MARDKRICSEEIGTFGAAPVINHEINSEEHSNPADSMWRLARCFQIGDDHSLATSKGHGRST